jgi:hypothetical protein
MSWRMLWFDSVRLVSLMFFCCCFVTLCHILMLWGIIQSYVVAYVSLLLCLYAALSVYGSFWAPGRSACVWRANMRFPVFRIIRLNSNLNFWTAYLHVLWNIWIASSTYTWISRNLKWTAILQNLQLERKVNKFLFA